MLLPPLDLQHRFAAIAESIEEQIATQRAHLAELDTLFASQTIMRKEMWVEIEGPFTTQLANAIRDAGIDPADIHYVNAHGTSTPLGDRAESDAIKTVFGDHAYRLAVSSTKSMTGHMLGAAGASEAVFSLLAMRDSIAPPTINLENPDPQCDLDYVPNTAREMKIDIALSNSFDFGGTNGTLVLRRPT